MYCKKQDKEISLIEFLKNYDFRHYRENDSVEILINDEAKFEIVHQRLDSTEIYIRTKESIVPVNQCIFYYHKKVEVIDLLRLKGMTFHDIFFQDGGF